MAGQCIKREELGQLLEAGPADPRYRHVTGCPRCRAELAMYRSFLAGNPELADATREGRLAERMHRLILDSAATGGSSSAPEPAGRRFLRFGPRQSLWALAAVLVLIVAINRLPSLTGEPVIRLRSSAPAAGAALAPVVKAAGETGDLLLAWTLQPGADSYRIEILGSDLSVLRRESVTGTESFPVSARMLDELSSRSPALLWRVTALAEGRVLAVSSLQVLSVGPMP